MYNNYIPFNESNNMSNYICKFQKINELAYFCYHVTGVNITPKINTTQESYSINVSMLDKNNIDSLIKEYPFAIFEEVCN